MQEQEQVVSLVVSQEKVPFSEKDILGLEIFGTILMFILIFVANMGGLSGAGTNIPIMLLCYKLDMKEAVPLSAAVAVCATVFRFVLNFSQKHPNDKNRVAINYEVVEITMPFVFLGSFIGVKLGFFFQEWVRVLVFGATVAWSLQTTIKKALSLIKKEKEAEMKKSLLASDPGAAAADTPSSQTVQNANTEVNATGTSGSDSYQNAEGKGQKALENIRYEEGHHFTARRVVFIMINLVLLMSINYADHQYPSNEGNDLVMKSLIEVFFLISMVLMTVI